MQSSDYAPSLTEMAWRMSITALLTLGYGDVVRACWSCCAARAALHCACCAAWCCACLRARPPGGCRWGSLCGFPPARQALLQRAPLHPRSTAALRHPTPLAQFPTTLALQLVLTLEQLLGLLMSAFLVSIVITKASAVRATVLLPPRAEGVPANAAFWLTLSIHKPPAVAPLWCRPQCPSPSCGSATTR